MLDSFLRRAGLLLTRPINAGFYAEGNQSSKGAGAYVILTLPSFLPGLH